MDYICIRNNVLRKALPGVLTLRSLLVFMGRTATAPCECCAGGTGREEDTDTFRSFPGRGLNGSFAPDKHDSS